MDVGALVVPRPRAQHVARADELHRPAAEHVDLAARQPFHEQEPAVVDLRLQRAGHVPVTRVEPLHARQRLVARAAELLVAEQLRQLRVGVDDADHAWGHVRGHTLEVRAHTRRLKDRRGGPTLARPLELPPTTPAGAPGPAPRGGLDPTGAPRLGEDPPAAPPTSSRAVVAG